MLSKLLILIEQGYGLLLSRLTAFFSLHLGDFKLLDLIMHSPHDLLLDLPDLRPLWWFFRLAARCHIILLLLLVRGADLQVDDALIEVMKIAV